MDTRIDLTLNNDFSERTKRTVVPLLFNNQNERIPKRTVKTKVTDSEMNRNFLTGTIDSINERKYYLDMMRSMDLVDAYRCDRCGGEIFFKGNTLCESCDVEFDEIMKRRRLGEWFGVTLEIE